MSAKVVIAWVLTISSITLALWALFGVEQIRSVPLIRTPGLAVLVIVGLGLLYVMLRGRFGEWGRLTLAALAFVASLGSAALALWIAAFSDY
jgi:hypothetical protein